MGTLAGGLMHRNDQTAYCEGFWAAKNGSLVTVNPHGSDDLVRQKAWTTGWNDETAGLSAPRCNVLAGTAAREASPLP